MRLSRPPDERLDTPPAIADTPADTAPVEPLDSSSLARGGPAGDTTPVASLEAEPAAVEAAPAVPARAVPLNWKLVVGIVVADQLSKALIRQWLAPYDSITIIPNFMDFTYVENPGVAFGLLSTLATPWKAVVTTTLALVALAGIAYYARHIRPDEKLARLGLSVILGGAIGNLIDRLWVQHVLDFVDVYVGSWHFWAFNIADASITIGAVLVFLDLLTSRHASSSV
jgi:signal peptidase II